MAQGQFTVQQTTSFVLGATESWDVSSDDWEDSGNFFGDEMEEIILNPLGIVSQVAYSVIPTFTEIRQQSYLGNRWNGLSANNWEDESTHNWESWY